MAALNVLLRGKECTMQEGTVLRIEPISRIERQELNLRPFRKLRRLFHYKLAIVNTSLDCHVGENIIPTSLSITRSHVTSRTRR